MYGNRPNNTTVDFRRIVCGMKPNLERKQTWHRLYFVIDLYVQDVKMCQRGNEMGRRVCQTPGPWRTPALELSTIPTSPSARQARLCHPDPLPAPLRPPKASRTASALGSTTGPSSRFTGRRRRPLTPGMPPSTREPSPSTSPACRRSPPRPASPNTAARCPAWRSDPCPSTPRRRAAAAVARGRPLSRYTHHPCFLSLAESSCLRNEGPRCLEPPGE